MLPCGPLREGVPEEVSSQGKLQETLGEGECGVKIGREGVWMRMEGERKGREGR